MADQRVIMTQIGAGRWAFDRATPLEERNNWPAAPPLLKSADFRTGVIADYAPKP